nr:GntR family transcriptional regulator [uncultured Oscillibacter sp.]
MISNRRIPMNSAVGHIYEELFRQIIHGDLTANTLLSESDIAKQMESSRTPVREALLMLEGDGLVRRYPGRGYMVTEITPQDVDDIFELRLQLELLALRKAYGALSPELLQELREQLEQLNENSSPDEFYCADRRLHELLAQYCGNSRLQTFLDTLDSQIERLRYISARRPDRLGESRAEHLDIIHALIAQDLPLAEEMLARHIRNVGESTKSVCRQQRLYSPFPQERTEMA